MPSVSDFSAEAAEILARLGAEPVVIGALAAIRFRIKGRATADADFLVCDVPGIAEAFRQRGYEVRVMTNPDGSPYFYAVRGGGDVRVDLIVAETDYQQTAMARATDGHISVEDVIVHKLIAWRGRDQDDIRSILEAGHTLDREYIARWAAEWEVSDRWAEAQTWR